MPISGDLVMKIKKPTGDSYMIYTAQRKAGATCDSCERSPEPLEATRSPHIRSWSLGPE